MCLDSFLFMLFHLGTHIWASQRFWGCIYCHLFWDVINFSVHGRSTHNCGSFKKEYREIKQLCGLSSLFVKEISGYLFPFCPISLKSYVVFGWVSFRKTRTCWWNCHARLFGPKKVEPERPDSS